MTTAWRLGHPHGLSLQYADKPFLKPSPSFQSRSSNSKTWSKPKEQDGAWKLQWSDFDLRTWFDVPEEAIAELLEKEKRKEEGDGWGGVDWDEDWTDEETDESSVFTFVDENGVRRSERNRDTWLQPTNDAKGFFDRIELNDTLAESRTSLDWRRNQTESRSALKFVGFLIGCPLLTGFILSRSISGPLISCIERNNPEAFAATPQQKIAGAHQLRAEQADIKIHVLGGDIEPLDEDEIFQRLSKKALSLNAEYVDHNKTGMLDAISDTISAFVFIVIIATANEGVQYLLSTSNRFFRGLSDTAKAFLIILIADVLLGYHSEEGWTAVIRMIGSRYGDVPEEGTVTLIVGTLPVFLDTCFKYWIFRGLNRRSPAAGVTLKTMNRH